MAASVGNSGGVLRWPPDGKKFRLLAGVLLLLFAGYAAAFLVVTAIRLAGPPHGDFFALWSAARFVLRHPAAQVYDPASLKASQLALGMAADTDYPFPYPPSFLLVLWPVGLSPFLPAYVAAMGLSLALYLWATIGRGWRSAMLLGALLAPTTTITIIAGQAGFAAAALLIGGARLVGRRPVVSGVLFGLASYKPQIGLLIPVALVACGAWRAIAAAFATMVALVLVSSLVFGLHVWPAWAGSLAGYAAEFASAGGKIGHLMPTVEASLLQLGASSVTARFAQFGAALIAAAAVWRCWRVGPPALAAAALFVATFLATPHALVYDLPPVTTAVLWMIAERQRAGGAFGSGEILVMLVATVAPVVLVAGGSTFPIVPLSLATLLAVIVVRCERLRRGSGAVAMRRSVC